jgi:hypothetical protein
MEPAVSAACWEAHEVENVTAGDGGLQRSGFSVHIRWRLYRTAPPEISRQDAKVAKEIV